MAGPYTGTWKQSVVQGAKYTGALKQGTGINPVHRIPGDLLGEPPTRQHTKLNYQTPDMGVGIDAISMIDDAFVNVPEDEPLAMYAYDAYPNRIWGYGPDTGLANRPRLDDRDQIPANQRFNNRSYPPWGDNPDFPAWGGSRKPEPSGNYVRSMDNGALVTMAARVLPNETVSEGWLNKAHGIAGDAIPSDDSQLVVNSSLTQRYKVRTGSQSTGRASEYMAPVPSRVTGQKLKSYSGGERHWDMTPYDQDEILRPFLSRQAGTGYPQWSQDNEMYLAIPRQKEPAPDPFPGDITPSTGLAYEGYTYEDVLY